MDRIYTEEDLKSFYDYLKKNPDAKIEDWKEYSRNTLTKEEKELFDGIEMAKMRVPVGDKKYYVYFVNCIKVFDETTGSFMRFADKYFGGRFIDFHPHPVSCIGTSLVVNDKDFFNEEYWSDGVAKGHKILEHKPKNGVELIVSMDMVNDNNEKELQKFLDWRGGMEDSNSHCLFWSMKNTHVTFFLKGNDKLSYKPVLPLFSESKTK